MGALSRLQSERAGLGWAPALTLGTDSRAPVSSCSGQQAALKLSALAAAIKCPGLGLWRFKECKAARSETRCVVVAQETRDGMPRATWWLKAQHDTLAQCLANSVPLVRAAARVTFSKLLRAPGRF